MGVSNPEQSHQVDFEQIAKQGQPTVPGGNPELLLQQASATSLETGQPLSLAASIVDEETVIDAPPAPNVSGNESPVTASPVAVFDASAPAAPTQEPAAPRTGPTIWVPGKQEPPPTQQPRKPGISRRTVVIAGAGGLALLAGAGVLTWLRGSSQTQSRVQPTVTVNTRPSVGPSPTSADRLFPIELEQQTLDRARRFLALDQDLLRQMDATAYGYIKRSGALVNAPTDLPYHLEGYAGQTLDSSTLTPATFAKQVMAYRFTHALIGPLQRGPEKNQGVLFVTGGFSQPGEQFIDGKDAYLLLQYSNGYGGVKRPTTRQISEDPNQQSDLGNAPDDPYSDMGAFAIGVAGLGPREVVLVNGADPNHFYGPPPADQTAREYDAFVDGEIGPFILGNHQGRPIADPKAVVRRVEDMPSPNEQDMSKYIDGPYGTFLILA